TREALCESSLRRYDRLPRGISPSARVGRLRTSTRGAYRGPEHLLNGETPHVKGLTNAPKSIIMEFKDDLATVMAQTNADAMAGGSFDIAKASLYAKTKPVVVPLIDHFVDLTPGECSTKAPEEICAVHVDGSASFKNAETLKLVCQRVFMAGTRLAA